MNSVKNIKILDPFVAQMKVNIVHDPVKILLDR